VIADALAEHLGAPPEERDATYWSTLFLAAGCTGVSFELSGFFGDDIAFRAGLFDKLTNLSVLGYVMRRAGGDGGLGQRTKVRLDLLRSGMSSIAASLLAHCAVSAEMARRLDLGDAVVESLLQTFEQWDGKGIPDKLRGEQVGRAIRVANLAALVEVHDRAGGVPATLAAAAKAASTVGPSVVASWSAVAGDVLPRVDAESSWEQVIAREPRTRGPLTNDELDAALELMADWADLKSPWLTGHSRGVASLAVAAGQCMGLPEEQLVGLRRAALVHDIGRNGVPNSIWDKPGPLTMSERERVRLHSYYTDRVLHRAGRLGLLASIASAGHERADGSGYPRAVTGAGVPLLGRILAAADTYHALLEDRPHRAAWSRDDAGGELRRAAREGELDPAAVDGVLLAAGHPVRRSPAAPFGLTRRELEVLRLVARGRTTKGLAAELGITPKTAGNHVERIYQKIGVSTRAEAAMFAMQHELVGGWDLDQT
jgi:HD-GYP domain-containing protein (c-di-GMP phosphodiesterase class II)/DNA-binding CsgD family transcriptional regulator